MNEILRQKDEAIADAIFARKDIADLIAKFPECDDYALRQDPVSLGVYLHMRDRGGVHSLCLMEACRSAPGIRNSDRNFNEAARRRMESMLPRNRDKICEVAREAGINTQGKFYVGGLGKYNDPAAWVSSTDDIIASARAKNVSVEGAVNVQAIKRDEPPKRIRMAPDIIQQYQRKYIKNDPALAEKVRKNPKKHLPALTERIVHTHSKPQED